MNEWIRFIRLMTNQTKENGNGNWIDMIRMLFILGRYFLLLIYQWWRWWWKWHIFPINHLTDQKEKIDHKNEGKEEEEYSVKWSIVQNIIFVVVSENNSYRLWWYGVKIFSLFFFLVIDNHSHFVVVVVVMGVENTLTATIF